MLPRDMSELTVLRRSAVHCLAGVPLVLASCVDFTGGGEPSVEVSQELASPDGSRIATSFYCEGGGAAGYAFNNVALTRAGEALDPLDGLLGKYKTWNSFHDIQLAWRDDGSLDVSYRATGSHDDVQQTTRVAARHGVDIHYRLIR